MQLKPITAIAVLLLVVTSLSVAGCVNTPSDQTPTPSASATPSATPSIQSDKTFTSDQGFNITYPKTWGLSVNNSTGIRAVDKFVILTMSPNVINVVTVASGKADEITGTTLQTYTDYILNAAKQSSGYSLLSYESTTIGGQPANKIVYTATVPQRIGTTTQNAQIKTMQYLVVHNGKQYVVAYKTVQDDYDKYLTQAQEVINSFKFTS